MNIYAVAEEEVGWPLRRLGERLGEGAQAWAGSRPGLPLDGGWRSPRGHSEDH